MLEDAAATAAYERTRSEEMLPHAMVKRLAAGESPLRVWREHRDLTQEVLASRAGIKKAYLSQLESGHRKGTVDTMRKLAAALDIDYDELLLAEV